MAQAKSIAFVLESYLYCSTEHVPLPTGNFPAPFSLKHVGYFKLRP